MYIHVSQYVKSEMCCISVEVCEHFVQNLLKDKSSPFTVFVTKLFLFYSCPIFGIRVLWMIPTVAC